MAPDTVVSPELSKLAPVPESEAAKGAAMGIHYTAYCKKSVAHVTPDALLKGVTAADLAAAAKKVGVSEEDITSALDRLRIENMKPPGFVVYRLHYRPRTMRQVDVECWESKDDLQAILDEELEELAGHPHFKPISAYLKQCVDVLEVSCAPGPAEAMGQVLAVEAARWLAGHFDGVIRTADEKWWRLGPDGGFLPL
jgi:hypothetical protein